MKKIEGTMPPVFENNYKPKEAIDWEEIERLRRQHNPQFGVLNILFGFFNILNFIIQDLLLSEWKKVMKAMFTTQEKTIIQEFSKDELIIQHRDWTLLLALKKQLESQTSEDFKKEFHAAFYQLDIALFNDHLDMAYQAILPLMKEHNKRSSYQVLQPFTLHTN